MVITWYGLSCFRLQTKDASVIIDPFEESVGLKLPVPSKLPADIVLSSREGPQSRNLEAASGSPLMITTPGEYEAKNAFVYGNSVPADKGEGTIFRIETEDLTVVVLSALRKPLGNGEIEAIEGVDIVLLPVGGGETLLASEAVELVSEIEPRIIIPCLYAVKGWKAKSDSVEKFLKEFGVKNPEKTDKYKITRKELPQDEVKVVILEAQS